MRNMKTNALKKKIQNTIVYKKVKSWIVSKLYIFPVQNNKIIFDNFGGRGFGDDPKYIAEELLQRNLGLKIIWVTASPNISVPSGIQIVKYGTIRAAYHWITARVWVDNIKSTIRPPKRKGQYYIQTWHSTLGFKKNEEDAENLPIRYIEQAKADGKQIDLMYSDNDFRCDKYRNHFWYSGEVLKCDVPRTGALLKENKMRINKVYCELKVNPKRKIVLYAPTFRKNVDKTVYYVNADAICKMLEKKFGESFTFALRLHPNNADIADEIAKEMNVVNATKYPDMQELLVASAVLITDYSGCMFDFGFARKPVFLLAKDVERYIKEERKWYFGLDEVPFTLSRSEKELCESVEKFDKEEYKHQCEIFEKKIGFSDSGNGAKIIADRIVDQMRRSL